MRGLALWQGRVMQARVLEAFPATERKPPLLSPAAASVRGAGGTLAISAVLAAFEFEIDQAREQMRAEIEKFLEEVRQGGVLTRKEAAQYIGCGLTKFDSLVKGGRIKAVSYDEHCRFRKETCAVATVLSPLKRGIVTGVPSDPELLTGVSCTVGAVLKFPS